MSQARRDASLADTDSVILVFDTFNDSQNAFVFGTNAIGIEYDGQVAREGQTSGLNTPGLGAVGGAGTQRGTISAFNPNWDGDWTVRAAVTERGWEAEMAIPLKTLRYAVGTDRTWGFNVVRNIRHKNEQVFLSPIPRGFDIYRISQAAKITGIDLAARRDIKVTPYALASANKDFTRTTGQLDRRATAGGELKWGITPGLTLDATVNTDFAQVEADDEQVNLTRFDLFFPEKRPFFLENASLFQFGQPQSIDLFFSRRIGLSASGAPIDIVGGTRLSGKLGGGWNVGLLDIQTDRAEDHAGPGDRTRHKLQRAPHAEGSRPIDVRRHVRGPLRYGGRSRGTSAMESRVRARRGRGRVARQRVSAFVARTDSPGAMGSDSAARVFYNFTSTEWQVFGGVSQVGDRFNPEVGFLPRRGYRRPEMRLVYNMQPERMAWIRRYSPHMAA